MNFQKRAFSQGHGFLNNNSKHKLRSLSSIDRVIPAKFSSEFYAHFQKLVLEHTVYSLCAERNTSSLWTSPSACKEGVSQPLRTDIGPPDKDYYIMYSRGSPQSCVYPKTCVRRMACPGRRFRQLVRRSL